MRKFEMAILLLIVMVEVGTAHQFEISFKDRPNDHVAAYNGINQRINGGGEIQPILWDAKYGPINISLPARSAIYYMGQDQLPNDDEGIIVGDVEVRISFNNQLDLVQKVIQEASTNNITYPSMEDFNYIIHPPRSIGNSDISQGKNPYGLPIATNDICWVDQRKEYPSSEVSVGTCRLDNLTLTIFVYNEDPNRVKLILNSIH